MKNENDPSNKGNIRNSPANVGKIRNSQANERKIVNDAVNECKTRHYLDNEGKIGNDLPNKASLFRLFEKYGPHTFNIQYDFQKDEDGTFYYIDIRGKIRQVYPPKNFLSPISLKIRKTIVLVNLF